MNDVSVGRAIVASPQIGSQMLLTIRAGVVELVNEFRKIDPFRERTGIFQLIAEVALNIVNHEIRHPAVKIENDFDSALAGTNDRNRSQFTLGVPARERGGVS